MATYAISTLVKLEYRIFGVQPPGMVRLLCRRDLGFRSQLLQIRSSSCQVLHATDTSGMQIGSKVVEC
jgi:hypothetical protein